MNGEVVSIMLTLYSQEQATKMMLATERKEALAEGRAEGRIEGRIEGRAEALAEGRIQQAKEIAERLYSLEIEIEIIAQGVGYSVDDVKKWIGLLS